MKAVAAFAAIAVTAGAAPAAQPQQVRLDLTDFFHGRTRGEGTLKLALRRPVRVTIDSIGRDGSDGEFTLTDTIREEGKPTVIRRWVMRSSGPNRYTGTLTDAVGPVRVEVDGPQATIRYKMKDGGIAIHQVLTMRDRRTLSNHVTGKKLGIRVARLDGTIRKLD